MYSIHVVCLSVRQTFAYYIPLYNANYFLDPLVVCCTQNCPVSVRASCLSGFLSAALHGAGVQRQRQQLERGLGRGIEYKGKSKVLPT